MEDGDPGTTRGSLDYPVGAALLKSVSGGFPLLKSVGMGQGTIRLKSVGPKTKTGLEMREGSARCTCQMGAVPLLRSLGSRTGGTVPLLRSLGSRFRTSLNI